MLLKLCSASTGTSSLITALESTGEQLLFSVLFYAYITSRFPPPFSLSTWGERNEGSKLPVPNVYFLDQMYWFTLF